MLCTGIFIALEGVLMAKGVCVVVRGFTNGVTTRNPSSCLCGNNTFPAIIGTDAVWWMSQILDDQWTEKVISKT